MAELSGEAVDAAPHPTVTRRQITAAVIGNALEFYDFTTYALFAVQIGRTFFPSQTPFENLMLSLLTFAVGFVGRPVGAIVIGRFGDRAGRKPAMLLSFTLMGVGILGIVLTPSYAMIGPAAPVLLLVFRLIQGFALGGEVGPTTAFLIEAAPPTSARPDRRMAERQPGDRVVDRRDRRPRCCHTCSRPSNSKHSAGASRSASAPSCCRSV